MICAKPNEVVGKRCFKRDKHLCTSSAYIHSNLPHMAKNLNYLFLLIFFPLFVGAQSFNTDEFNAKRYKINETGMKVLGAWAIGNLAYSGVAVFNNTGQNKAFHQMNIGWGAINLALAGVGYLGTRDAATNLSVIESLKQLESTKRIFLFNAGLDIGYMATGAYMLERSKNTSNQKRSDQLAGFGKSIMVQGGFLFAFDLVMYFVHQNHGKKQLYNLVSDLSVSPSGFRVVMNF